MSVGSFQSINKAGAPLVLKIGRTGHYGLQGILLGGLIFDFKGSNWAVKAGCRFRLGCASDFWEMCKNGF